MAHDPDKADWSSAELGEAEEAVDGSSQALHSQTETTPSPPDAADSTTAGPEHLSQRYSVLIDDLPNHWGSAVDDGHNGYDDRSSASGSASGSDSDSDGNERYRNEDDYRESRFNRHSLFLEGGEEQAEIYNEYGENESDNNDNKMIDNNDGENGYRDDPDSRVVENSGDESRGGNDGDNAGDHSFEIVSDNDVVRDHNTDHTEGTHHEKMDNKGPVKDEEQINTDNNQDINTELPTQVQGLHLSNEPTQIDTTASSLAQSPQSPPPPPPSPPSSSHSIPHLTQTTSNDLSASIFQPLSTTAASASTEPEIDQLIPKELSLHAALHAMKREREQLSVHETTPQDHDTVREFHAFLSDKSALLQKLTHRADHQEDPVSVAEDFVEKWRGSINATTAAAAAAAATISTKATNTTSTPATAGPMTAGLLAAGPRAGSGSGSGSGLASGFGILYSLRLVLIQAGAAYARRWEELEMSGRSGSLIGARVVLGQTLAKCREEGVAAAAAAAAAVAAKQNAARHIIDTTQQYERPGARVEIMAETLGKMIDQWLVARSTDELVSRQDGQRKRPICGCTFDINYCSDHRVGGRCGCKTMGLIGVCESHGREFQGMDMRSVSRALPQI